MNGNEPSPSAAAIECTLLRDRHRLRRLQRDIRQRQKRSQPIDQLQSKFDQLLADSADAYARRKAKVPAVEYDAELPITAHRDEIIRTIQEHQVVVICGETGSGKSTQLPKLCLEAGYGVAGLIGHTQPRRIAASTIANRLAEELKCQLGEQVGYKIRFTDKTNPQTYIKLMTDGILLAETQGDRFLNQYEVIIIDEAHERSLNIDFLMGLLKRLLPQRPELRVIITSATIDAERFAEHFADETGAAPIIQVSGRSYPVEVLYRPLAGDGGDNEQLNGIVTAVHELAAIDTGHMLIFLPTERDIREAAKRLRAEKLPGDGSQRTEILPLYGRLSAAEQARVFKPNKYRRIVLATNVAESSLTVPGIRFVIDTGTARISRYAPRSKVQRLPIEAVSQASADQRKGRCGRVGPGICVRLFDEADFNNRAPYTTPEIQRTNLAAVILRAKALKLGAVDEFPFLDPPREETIRDGYRTLFEIGAIDGARDLTDIGRTLSRLPVDPRIGRILLAAIDERCAAEVSIIAAALEIQDPRERPHEKRAAADDAHEQFAHEQSDFLGYLKMWDFYQKQKEKLSHSRLRRACKQNFLSYNRLREWTEIHRQLKQLVAQSGLKGVNWTRDTDESVDSLPAEKYGAIHRSLLTGFLSGVAMKSAEYEYSGASNIKFHLWPGSGLFGPKPSWCMVSEIVETTRRYGRTVARVNPNWIEPLAKHVVKRTYSEPHFHKKSGSVMAYETVTLYGLPIVQRRRTPYGNVDPDEARDVFIREALALRLLESNLEFYQHNENLLNELAERAAMTRQGHFLIDEYTLRNFYDRRLPNEVHNVDLLRKWLKEVRKNGNPDVLHMQEADLLAEDGTELAEDAFPKELQVAAMTLPVDYHFAPGEDNDGVTVTIPLDGLPHISPARLSWVVPGLVEEKVTALIRSLPKSIRRCLIPAPDTAKKVAAELPYGEGDFLQVVAAKLALFAGEPVRPDDFQRERLATHLETNLKVVDTDGNVLAEGRDVAQLREELNVQPSTEVNLSAGDEAQTSAWTRDGITAWDFGEPPLHELPKQVVLQRGGIEVPVYPTLMDAGDSVRLSLVSSAAQSKALSRAGLRRLYAIAQRKQLRSQVAWLPRLDEFAVLAGPLITLDELKSQVTLLLADLAFLNREKKQPRDHESFAARLADSAERIGVATQEVAKFLPKLFESYHQVRLRLEDCGAAKWQPTVNDVQLQLNHLLPENFLVQTPWRWLKEVPRYLKAIDYRLERLAQTSAKDQETIHEITHHWQRYEQKHELNVAAGVHDHELVMYRWMVEEYRVSCFAQPIGTAFSISGKRLDKQWDKVG